MKQKKEDIMQLKKPVTISIPREIEKIESTEDSIAYEIMREAMELAERSEAIAKKFEDSLSLILIPIDPLVPDAPTETHPQTKVIFPPLFDNLRDRFWQIQRSLDQIESLFKRITL
jgi:hypothetical protein